MIQTKLEINLLEQEKLDRFLFDLIQNDKNNETFYAYLDFYGKLLNYIFISDH